jgi:hypothetical protein
LAFSYWTIKPWFLTEGKLLLCSSYLPLGVPNWSVIYISTGAIMAAVKILGLLVWAYTRFQKFLEISKPMCVSPCDMQPKFLAAQWQEVGAKFSSTWKVGRDVDQHIRWGVAPLGK